MTDKEEFILNELKRLQREIDVLRKSTRIIWMKD